MTRRGGRFRKDKGDLQRRYLDLEREWTSYKNQTMTPRSHPSAIAPITEPCENLPKQLMYSLQFDGPPSETKEIAMERRASIWSGRLRGRSLLEALEQAQNEKCSDCSSSVLEGFIAAGAADGRRWMLAILLSLLSVAAIIFIMESLSEEGGDWLTPT
ncbi:unnamed protein product [Spirodela intermedia]|uniref:Uncharacterized protein n=1 Tax=Spirodela intermedia TaxID=51605 RepID=A0A7I8IQY3_SPIIN|nr:unnamed protein product [Spirodela intermedia]CAA6659946.1 unnamed protein product [Spirodela intermedia]